MATPLDAYLACPRCHSPLALDAAAATCRCQGSSCGATFPFIDGIPRLSDGAVERDERIGAEWVAQHHALPLYLDTMSIANAWERFVLPSLLDATRSALEGGGGPVLDVGCGVGHLGEAASRRGLDFELVGLDFQAELLESARTGYAARVEGDVHRLPFRDASFSGAITANTLHHVADPVAVLRELGRILRPGAKLVAYDPRALAPLETAKKMLRHHDSAFTKDHRAFSVDEYRALFTEAGLVIDDLRTRDPIGPLLAAGLDLVGAGRLGVTGPVARALAAADSAITRLDRDGRFGLMVIAIVQPGPTAAASTK